MDREFAIARFREPVPVSLPFGFQNPFQSARFFCCKFIRVRQRLTARAAEFVSATVNDRITVWTSKANRWTCQCPGPTLLVRTRFKTFGDDRGESRFIFCKRFAQSDCFHFTCSDALEVTAEFHVDYTLVNLRFKTAGPKGSVCQAFPAKLRMQN